MNAHSKKKLALLAAALFVLALFGYAVYYALFSSRSTLELKPDAIVEVDRGDLTSVFMTTARVESGQQGVYEILDGTRVKEVHIRVGDAVRQGDLLATFDAGNLDEVLRARKRDYDSARDSYEAYMKTMSGAPDQAALKKQIAELEEKIAGLQAAESDPPAAEAPTPEGSQKLDGLKRLVGGFVGPRMAEWMVDGIFAASGSVAQTLDAFQSLLSNSLRGGLGSVDMSGLLGGMGANTELLGTSLQLMQLRVQESVMGLQAGISLDNVYKTLADTAESAYRQAQATVAQLKEGWYAAHDGVVREVNVTAGEVYRDDGNAGASSLDMTAVLASLAMGQADVGALLGGLFGGAVGGIVVEYYPFTASFLLGRYDIDKVALEQKVRVTSVSGALFDGFVSFISPVADTGGFDLSSIISGGSGGARGVEARVTIPQPDLSITIGLDVDVTIELESCQNVLRVPLSAMRYDNEEGKYYVFALERATKTVQRVAVDTGLFDNSGAVAWYEITGGVSEGEEILRVPPISLRDGDRVIVRNS